MFFGGWVPWCSPYLWSGYFFGFEVGTLNFAVSVHNHTSLQIIAVRDLQRPQWHMHLSYLGLCVGFPPFFFLASVLLLLGIDVALVTWPVAASTVLSSWLALQNLSHWCLGRRGCPSLFLWLTWASFDLQPGGFLHALFTGRRWAFWRTPCTVDLESPCSLYSVEWARFWSWLLVGNRWVSEAW